MSVGLNPNTSTIMHLLLGDETNRDENRGDFFIYGALYFDLDYMAEIDAHVRGVREEYGYGNGQLKWTYNAAPDHISHEEHTEAKNEVIKIAHHADATFVPVLVHHGIRTAVSREEQFTWAIRDVLSRYDYHLREIANDTGICALDPLPGSNGWPILEDIFHNGLSFEDRELDLDRIQMMATVSNDASHAPSVADIVLGSFGYCVNYPDRDASEKMFANVARLTYGYDEDDGLDFDYGILLRPKKIKSPQYKVEYHTLQSQLSDLLDRSLERRD